MLDKWIPGARAGPRMAIKNEGIDNENNRERAKTNLGPVLGARMSLLDFRRAIT